jgi:hypothetical protein
MEQLCGMDPWLTPLHRSFKQHADPMNATAMAAYMKGHFPYFGIKTPERRALMKEHMGIYGVPALNDLPAIVRKAFAYPEREMHQVGVDLLIKFAKILGPDHLPFVEEVITTKSWWDQRGYTRSACGRGDPEAQPEGDHEMEQAMDRKREHVVEPYGDHLPTAMEDRNGPRTTFREHRTARNTPGLLHSQGHRLGH